MNKPAYDKLPYDQAKLGEKYDNFAKLQASSAKTMRRAGVLIAAVSAATYPFTEPGFERIATSEALPVTALAMGYIGAVLINRAGEKDTNLVLQLAFEADQIEPQAIAEQE